MREGSAAILEVHGVRMPLPQVPFQIPEPGLIFPTIRAITAGAGYRKVEMLKLPEVPGQARVRQEQAPQPGARKEPTAL